MCLTKVDEKITNRKRRGWKVFRPRSEDLQSLFFRRWLRRSTSYLSIAEECWIEDPNKGKSSSGDDGQNYLVGFHVYLNKDDAEDVAADYPDDRVVRRIRFRKVVAQGIEKRGSRMAPTIVAQEMYIEKRNEQ